MTKSLTRRTFLHTALVATAGVLFGRPQAWALRSAEPLSPPKRLIVIFLRGAVDGLSVVIPYGDPRYYAARPTIAIPRAGDTSVLPLDAYFGIHPALTPVIPLWKEESLAFVHACGSPDPSRSHFDAQAYMESGTPGQRRTPDGWMNRLLTVLSETAGASTAVSIGPTVAPILSGPAPVTNLALGRGAGQSLPLDRPRIAAAFDRLYHGGDPLSRAYRAGQIGRQRLSAELDAEQQRADGDAPLPVRFAQDARQLARLLGRDPSIRLVFLPLGGWDTHVNQGASSGQLATHLRALAEGVATLRTELGRAYAETVLLILSEFGRTVHENGNGGTDHGHGNVMWVLGGKVRGRKVYGQWPGLAATSLYEGRDLAVTTDFRAVLGAVLHDHLGVESERLERVLPGASLMRHRVSGLVRG